MAGRSAVALATSSPPRGADVTAVSNIEPASALGAPINLDTAVNRAKDHEGEYGFATSSGVIGAGSSSEVNELRTELLRQQAELARERENAARARDALEELRSELRQVRVVGVWCDANRVPAEQRRHFFLHCPCALSPIAPATVSRFGRSRL